MVEITRTISINIYVTQKKEEKTLKRVREAKDEKRGQMGKQM